MPSLLQIPGGLLRHGFGKRSLSRSETPVSYPASTKARHVAQVVTLIRDLTREDDSKQHLQTSKSRFVAFAVLPLMVFMEVF